MTSISEVVREFSDQMLENQGLMKKKELRMDEEENAEEIVLHRKVEVEVMKM